MPAELPFGIREIEGYEKTGFGWPVVPEGLTEIVTTLHTRYGDRLPPLYITENGCALEEPHADDRRIAYLESHLTALRAAMDAGVDVRGYFTWSLTDNVEWTEGASQRFGLVHIDYETLTRTPKKSYAWYRDLIRAQKSQQRDPAAERAYATPAE